jgi:hypothetical protein
MFLNINNKYAVLCLRPYHVLENEHKTICSQNVVYIQPVTVIINKQNVKRYFLMYGFLRHGHKSGTHSARCTS